MILNKRVITCDPRNFVCMGSGWFGTSPRRSRGLIDEASVKEGLRRAS